MNTVVYQVACFMLVRNPTIWRWSHARHHTDTIIVGRDPEIITMRPPDIAKALLLFVGLDSVRSFFKMFRYATTGLNGAEKTFVPEHERWKVTAVRPDLGPPCTPRHWPSRSQWTRSCRSC